MTLIDKAEALLPCPFCGEAAYNDNPTWRIFGKRTGHGYAIACSNCEAVATGDDDPALAIAAWNRRASLPTRGVGVKPLRYIDPEGDTLDQMRENARQQPLAREGDMLLVWVNEGDLYEHAFPLAALAPTDAAQAQPDAYCWPCHYAGSCADHPQVPDAAQAREAALKKAAQLAYEVWDDPEALAKAILALIGEDRA